MTTATATKTKKFIVRYPVTTYYFVEVERAENITEEDLLNSITRDELTKGEAQNDCGWDSIKSAWRDGDAETYVYDEDDCWEEAFPINWLTEGGPSAPLPLY